MERRLLEKRMRASRYWYMYVKGRWYAITAREILAEAGPFGSTGTPIWWEFFSYFAERKPERWPFNLLAARPKIRNHPNSGQAALEYVLILGLVAGVVILLLLVIGTQTSEFLRSVVEAFK